jgi:hypothetical protein
MFDTILGLPVHALVVHAVVVLVPLAAVGLIAVAVHPAWRRPYLPVVALIATAGLAAVPVATMSGQKLENRIHVGGVIAQRVHDHAQMGRLVIYPTLVMWLLALAMLYLDRKQQVGRGMTIVAVLAVVGAIAAAGQVAITGHLGSKSVWGCTTQPEDCS